MMEQRAAIESERRRWARELHDGPLQELAAIRLDLGRDLRSTTPAALRAGLQRAAEAVDEQIAALRALITQPTPDATGGGGLPAAIAALAERAAARGLTVSVAGDLTTPREDDGVVGFGPQADNAVYQIVREAISNALRHGHATHVDVILASCDPGVALTVSDDGRGFDTAAQSGPGFGLTSMRQRATLLGGTLTVSSSPGAGTIVRGSLPLRAVPVPVPVPASASAPHETSSASASEVG